MSWKITRIDLAKLAALPCVIAFALYALPAGLGAATNLEEKAKYEKVLEQKVDELLVSVLGPGKAKVMVQATIDFSSTENISSVAGDTGLTQQGTEPPGSGAAAGAGENSLWWSEMMEKVKLGNPGTGAETKTKKAIAFPLAMLKSLNVSLVLSEDLSETEVRKIRVLISDMLGMDTGRGDKIQVMKARFAPLWYTPEMLALLVQYGVLATVLMVAMGIVAVGFLKMAGAMHSMAGTGQQKISMEMNSGGEMSLPPMDFAGQSALKDRGVGHGAIENSGGTPVENVVFNVQPEKLGILVNMMADDKPADIALVAVHLPAGLRSQFISSFSMEKGSEILANIAKVRFVPPEIISKIKEELEKRLSGSVGGYEQAMEIISNVDNKTKKCLYENLEKNHPEVATRVRSKIFFIEDIEKLPEKDFSMLIGAVSVEQWALAIWALPESVKPRLKAQMSKGGWQFVEQTLKYGRPAEVQINKAVGAIVSSVWKLILESKIVNPNESGAPSFGGGKVEIAFKPAGVEAGKNAPPAPPAQAG